MIKSAICLVAALILSVVPRAHAAEAMNSQAQPGYSVPGSVLTSQRVIALTFDDGPSLYTPQVLAILHAFNARATFFVIGRQVPQYPAYVRQAVSAGDEVGNHSYDHLDLRYVSNAGIKQDLTRTQQAVRSATGISPTWFHPPNGVIDSRIAADASAVGLRSVLWSVDPRDWSLPGTTAIVQRVLDAVHPGSIVLFHDGGGNRSETVAALSVILRTLQSEGYRFLTLSALFHLPAPSRCNEVNARLWFASARIAPAPSHAIYQYWLQSYCRGTNYGPATSKEYALSATVIAQNFARTAHRLEWDRATGAVSAAPEWDWAAQIFMARGIRPRRGTPITDAWFDSYFRGYNRGPALEQPRLGGGVETQCFLRACAMVRSGRVTWQMKTA